MEYATFTVDRRSDQLQSNWNGKIAFPDRNGTQPGKGCYEVLSVAENPRKTVYFLRLGEFVPKPYRVLLNGEVMGEFTQEETAPNTSKARRFASEVYENAEIGDLIVIKHVENNGLSTVASREKYPSRQARDVVRFLGHYEDADVFWDRYLLPLAKTSGLEWDRIHRPGYSVNPTIRDLRLDVTWAAAWTTTGYRARGVSVHLLTDAHLAIMQSACEAFLASDPNRYMRIVPQDVHERKTFSV